MAERELILTALLLFPIIFFLFRFVGCAQIAGLKDPGPAPASGQPAKPKVPNYADYILGKPNNPGSVKNQSVKPNGADVIGYWRLVDAAASTDAKDEKNFQPGKYRTSTDPDAIPGDFVTSQPSLIVSEPGVLGRFFNGGYVLIPAKSGLFTDEFTLEAWVLPGFAPGTEHTLFQAGGFYRAPFETTQGYHGFQIYATAGRAWQISLSPGGDAFKPLLSPPLIPAGDTRTHLAVTVQNATSGSVAPKRVTIYIDGKKTVENTIPFYSVPDGAPLLIGLMGDEQEPHNLETLLQPNVSRPIRSRVQEVVLHRKALSQLEIENHVDINR
jgi:Concanavalin A-like lectin/glucanases superfamily